MTTSTDTLTTAWIAVVHQRWQSPQMQALAEAIVALPVAGRFTLDEATCSRLTNQARLRMPALTVLFSCLTDAGLLVLDRPARPAPGAWNSYTLALPDPPVLPAQWDEIGPYALAAATALAAQPLAHWLVPDPDDRVPVLTDYLSITFEQAVLYGFVDRTADGRGVAVWIDHTRPAPSPVDYLSRRRRACRAYSGTFAILDAVLGSHTPATDHYRLALLTVAPGDAGDRHGNHAAALLKHRHAILDTEGVPIRADHVALADQTAHRQHGYQPIAPIPVPESGTSLHPMWRLPAVPAGTEPGS